MTLDRGTSPIVSIVLPTYRRAEMLRRSIDTVLAQSLENWELIVVDDNGRGHTAQVATAAVVEQYSEDPRIAYVVHEQNQGGGGARNTGINRARAPYVAFLDDDDAWYPEKLALQVACFERTSTDVAVVYGGFRRVSHTGPGRIEMPTPAGHTVATLLRRNAVGTTSLVMCRREALWAVGGFDPNLRSRQDLDLYLRLAQRFDFAYVDAPLLDYHSHDAEAIGKHQDGVVEAHRFFYDKHRKLYEVDRGAHHVAMRRLGEEVLRTGRMREARSLLWFAWKLERRSWRTFVLALVSHGPVLAAYRRTREVLGLRRPTPKA